MIEGIVAVAIAALSGLGVITTRLHSRIDALDKRVDEFSLTVATDYLSKEDFSKCLDRVETHMLRIENKLDQIFYKWLL